MIRITYKEFPDEGVLSLRAEGHAGYAPEGQDIVCAAVSALVQALAFSVADGVNGGSIHGMPLYSAFRPTTRDLISRPHWLTRILPGC